MTAIDVKYQQVIKANPWIGQPSGPEQSCSDGVGRFREYQGGASIYYTPKTSAHLVYGLIRAKWVALGREQGPNGYPTSDEADAASGKGRYNNFQNGTIIWRRGAPAAFSVYGAIYGKWATLKYDAGALGFPLTDETAAVNNSGRFNDFEHGAIYYNASAGTHVVRSPILEAWSVAGRENGLLKFATSDTPATKDGQGAYIQAFQGGRISCTEGPSRSLVTASTVICHIAPVTRAAILEDSKNPNDTRALGLTRLNRHLSLKTALVIFRGSYTRTLDDAEITKIKSSYQQAKQKINEFTFGLGGIEPTIVVAETLLKKSDFVDYGGDTDPSTFQAQFNAYPKVIAALQAHGLSADEFDIVSINIPWADTAKDRASGLAWSNNNPNFRLGNNKTWTTIHYIYPGPNWGDKPAIWWAFYVHETTHCLQWMLHDHGYAQMRNPDDAWWAASYPHLASSKIVPSPENLQVPGDPRLYAMHQRIKSSWFGLAPTWGHVATDATTLDNYGQILTYSCPDARTVIETAWNIKYVDICPTPTQCAAIPSKLKALETDKQGLQADLQDASPTAKSALVQQINKINDQITALNGELAACNAQKQLATK